MVKSKFQIILSILFVGSVTVALLTFVGTVTTVVFTKVIAGSVSLEPPLLKPETAPGNSMPPDEPNIKPNPLSVAEEIRFESMLSNNSDLGHPLPLAGHWSTGSSPGGFNPSYQLQLIEKGHHILPWFQLPEHYTPKLGAEYYKKPLQKASGLNLPISFLSSQWERPLTDSQAYLYLPPDKNPNVVGLNGQILKKVSPFSSLGPWWEVGKKVTSSVTMKKLQEWYPNPPLVLFVSNNEHTKLKWTEAWISSRYRATYGRNTTELHKRKTTFLNFTKEKIIKVKIFLRKL